MAWINKPDENDLPSDVQSTTPRDGNAQTEYNHHTHHNSLANSVKTLIDELDAAIGTSTALDEKLADLTSIKEYKTMAVVYTNGNLTGTGASVIASAGASATPSTLMPGETLAAGDELLVFHTNTISALISAFGGTVQAANLLFYLFMCPFASPSGVYTVQNNGSWTRNATQPSVGEFFSFSTSSYFAGSIFNVVSINNLSNYFEGSAGNLIVPSELDGTYALRTNVPFLSNTVINRFDGEIPAWLGGSMVSQGGGNTTINILGDPLYTVAEVFPFPVEGFEWDIVNDPCPLAVTSVGEYDNKYLLLADQDGSSNGIYQFPENAHLDPVQFVENPALDSDNIGKFIRVSPGIVTGPSDFVIHKTQSSSITYRRAPLSVSVLTVYDANQDINSTPLIDDGLTPLYSITLSPVPVLLLGQDDSNENGLYFAVNDRFAPSTFQTPEGYDLAVPVNVAFGPNGDFDTFGNQYLWVTNVGYVELTGGGGSPGPAGDTGDTGATGPAGADGAGVIVLEYDETVPVGLPAGTKILRRPAI